MANLGTLFKSEISRLARKEIRAEITALRKSLTQHRSALASLRKELEGVRKQLRAVAKPRVNAAAEQEPAATRRRFQAKGLITHRKKLGLSAAAYGQLVGVSGLTVYKWESGTHPRAKQLEALATVRKMGKREATARLEEIASAAAPIVRRRRGPTRKPAVRSQRK